MHTHVLEMRMPYFATEKLADEHSRSLATTIIKVEMTKRKMSYRDLVGALAEYGVTEEERNLRNKIARGTFSAAFFFTCLGAMKVKNLDLSHWLTTMDDVLADIRNVVAGKPLPPVSPEKARERHENVEALGQVLLAEFDGKEP